MHLLGSRRRRVVAGAALVFVSACDGSLSPLRNHAIVGEDAYAVFVADGPARRGELYGIRGDGGQVFPITFTNVAESRPVLSPDGSMVAFLRARSIRDTVAGAIWVMNLLSGAERELELPKKARPVRLGWSDDGQRIVARTTDGLYWFAAPPADSDAQPVPPAERAAAESVLAVLLGEPAFARVVPCSSPADLCIEGDSGSSLLARGAHGPLRWSADSVAYFVGDRVEIRPLGPGRVRWLDWATTPRRPREMTYFGGGPRSAGEP